MLFELLSYGHFKWKGQSTLVKSFHSMEGSAFNVRNRILRDHDVILVSGPLQRAQNARICKNPHEEVQMYVFYMFRSLH